ncbi:COP9 signalosome complex subunit 9-like [Glandiceps talaboti]
MRKKTEEESGSLLSTKKRLLEKMKPSVVADEMFPEGGGPYVDLEEAGGSAGLLMDLAANEKAVHGDFFNDFEDLFDDEDLT